MEKNFKNYLKLFKSTFFISAFTFGGGYVIIPLMKKKFVDEFNWLDEEEMLNIAAIAQSTPGAMAVNAAILVGYRLLGVLGALVSILATALPPIIILSVISIFYKNFRENKIVNAVLKGTMAGVSAIILDVVFTMGSKIIKGKKIIQMLIIPLAFIAYFFFKLNIIYIILFCAVLGAFLSLLSGKIGKELI